MSRCSTAVLTLSIFLAGAALAAPVLRSNSVKYRDSSLPHATGRAGTATIDALALFGSDGMTTLSVSANGTLDKVQIRPDGANAVNFNGLGSPAFTQQLDELVPHQPLHVEANVSDADGSRTDVVAADEIVKYRPDLAVLDVRAPERAMPATPFAVTATIRELNGDLGARANCVLSADGVEIDRANGIWVDAHDSVACSFRATLGSMGSHTLTVSATGVEPGDYNDDNNAASTTISIAEPFDYYSFGALEGDTVNHQLMDWPNYHEEANNDDRQQWYSLYGNRMTELSLDALRVHVVEMTDGTPVTEKSFDSAIRGSAGDCVYGFDDYTSYNACLGHWDGAPHVNFQIERQSHSVTYLARTWNLQDGSESDTYLFTATGPSGIHYGATVSLALSITDGTTTIEAAPTVSLASYSRSPSGGWREICRPVPGGRFCLHFIVTDSGRRGSTSASGSY
jgi:hypothetical protein